MDCPRCKVGLKNVFTPKGILVDYCPDCQGIWFDRGEILHYSSAPENLQTALSQKLRGEHPGEGDCPRCATRLFAGGLLSDDLEIDRCPSCEGIWLDPSELTRLAAAESSLTGKPGMLAALAGKSGAVAELSADGRGEPGRRRPHTGELPTLPNLLIRSVGTFVVLYGLLGVIAIVLVEAEVIPLEVGVLGALFGIAFNYLVSPWILDFMLRFFMRCTWVAPHELPAHLAAFVAERSKAEGVEFRWFGLVDDGTPNAFTYGHHPGNARIVITRGLLARLSPREAEAVVAHEIGHAVHWDILVMTMASCVPILLYYLFRVCSESMKGGGRKDKDPRAIIMIVSYLAYVIAEYVVLYLSRTREYWADRYAAQATGEPNALSRALVKIAYGLAADDGEAGEAREAAMARRERLRAFGPLGIFDAASARGLVASSLRARAKRLEGDGETFSRENVVGAMQWDLWNPWAMYYELHSTHPLPAKRIEALSKTAEAMKQEPFVTFDERQPESYWDDFLVDVFVHFLPLLGFLGGFGGALALGREVSNALGFAIALYGAASLVKLAFVYAGDAWLPRSIASLLKVVKVSGVRPVPAEIKGKILGKGIPGYFLSEDLTLDDGTGYIFLDYNQPLAVFNWIFALRNDRFIGFDVTVRGWYRRAPVPYFEIYQLDTFEGTKTCWAPLARKLWALAVTALGLLIVFG